MIDTNCRHAFPRASSAPLLRPILSPHLPRVTCAQDLLLRLVVAACEDRLGAGAARRLPFPPVAVPPSVWLRFWTSVPEALNARSRPALHASPTWRRLQLHFFLDWPQPVYRHHSVACQTQAELTGNGVSSDLLVPGHCTAVTADSCRRHELNRRTSLACAICMHARDIQKLRALQPLSVGRGHKLVPSNHKLVIPALQCISCVVCLCSLDTYNSIYSSIFTFVERVQVPLAFGTGCS